VAATVCQADKAARDVLGASIVSLEQATTAAMAAAASGDKAARDVLAASLAAVETQTAGAINAAAKVDLDARSALRTDLTKEIDAAKGSVMQLQGTIVANFITKADAGAAFTTKGTVGTLHYIMAARVLWQAADVPPLCQCALHDSAFSLAACFR